MRARSLNIFTNFVWFKDFKYFRVFVSETRLIFIAKIMSRSLVDAYLLKTCPSPVLQALMKTFKQSPYTLTRRRLTIDSDSTTTFWTVKTVGVGTCLLPEIKTISL